MPEIINVNDSEALVRAKIIEILTFDGISTTEIISWGVATNRLNLAANRLGLLTLSNNMAGAEARARINALALSPAPVFPNNTALPEISGTVAEGEILTATPGTWEAYPAPTFTYQWQADGVNIVGATNNQYTLTASDIGKTITVEVTATNLSGFSFIESSSTGPVIPENFSLDFTLNYNSLYIPIVS